MENAVPLVSVLMPVYNGQEFLRPAIESILAQTFTDFEFIIINDGSTDGSEEIILSYTDPRIRYARNEQNIKLIATLNKGLKLCKGKYIARMDADDISFPERFSKQVAYMESHPECGLLGTDVEMSSGQRSFVRMGEEFMNFCLLFNNPLCHPTTFIRASIIREHNLEYPKEYIHAEEYVLWLDIMKYSKVVNLDEKLVYYRLHVSQVSQKYKVEQQQIGARIRLELLDEIVPFYLPGLRKAHLYIAGITTRRLAEMDFDDIRLKFNWWEIRRWQVRVWVRMMRFSLRLRKKWDSVYFRRLIEKVEDGIKATEWPSLRYRLSHAKNNLLSKEKSRA